MKHNFYIIMKLLLRGNLFKLCHFCVYIIVINLRDDDLFVHHYACDTTALMTLVRRGLGVFVKINIANITLKKTYVYVWSSYISTFDIIPPLKTLWCRGVHHNVIKEKERYVGYPTNLRESLSTWEKTSAHQWDKREVVLKVV